MKTILSAGLSALGIVATSWPAAVKAIGCATIGLGVIVVGLGWLGGGRR